MLPIASEEGEGEEDEPEPGKEAALEEITGGEDTMELVLQSVLGFSALGTMKIKGTIKGREVVVMIHCGATHNFKHQNIVMQLELPLTETTNYGGDW